MPAKIHPAAPHLYDDETGDGLPLLYYDNDNDRLPLAAPIIFALSLSLWAGIGFVAIALHSW